MNLNKEEFEKVYIRRMYPHITVYYADNHILLINNLYLWVYPVLLSAATLTSFWWAYPTYTFLALLGLKFYIDMSQNPFFDKRVAIYKNGDVKVLSFNNKIKNKEPLGEIEEIDISAAGVAELFSKPSGRVYELSITGSNRDLTIIASPDRNGDIFCQLKVDLEDFFNCKEKKSVYKGPACYRKPIW
ncbi:hypothetical protein [Neptuniibacter sp. 1_MG-2023]|jgi:hypothetical protein|uniref:hypothetical protein n=1 Tax=Neptuniibacter sp. 1_MG-2023 TaxID=3062662 RepID=UPI0026E2BC85|nr:hypothetical protein [Neptuniibacter sp. 1_MG-2023]MDO6594353.1 hypothetical protein [Neptuniibacter sp. 1_MG-2023]